MDCEKFADFRIDAVKAIGSDHAFACSDHLQQILIPMLKVSKGHAARVCHVPVDSQEMCELGVE
jgi:hypothetical protein